MKATQTTFAQNEELSPTSSNLFTADIIHKVKNFQGDRDEPMACDLAWNKETKSQQGKLKEKGVAVPAAILWSAWPRCIESRRYPSCRSWAMGARRNPIHRIR